MRDVQRRHRRPAPICPLVDADYTLLDQVITNLLENAVRHSPPLGTVRIAARRRRRDCVEISISDQGPGIPAERAGLDLRAFRTGTASRSSGVGLAICKAIVEAHGGTSGVTDARGGGAHSPSPCRPTGSGPRSIA